MDSDSSSYCETTYSEDERIENALRKATRIAEKKAREEDEARRELFQTYSRADLPVFELPGIEFHTFRHKKIKFSLHPGTFSDYVNKNVRFYVSLKYRNKHWRVKRDSFPANFKWKMYRLFYEGDFFVIDDENVFAAVEKIYRIVVEWTRSEEKFRRSKYQRFKNGEDVELDTDDEQLFLSQSERVALYRKRVNILKRMIPPQRN